MDDTNVEHNAADVQESALESEFKQLRHNHKARLEQLSSLMSSIQSLSESAEAESESIESLEQSAHGQLDYLKKSLEETVSGRGGLEARLQELTEALAATESEKAAMADKLSALNGQDSALDALKAELATKSDAVASLEEQTTGLQKALDEAQARLTESENRAAALEQESASRSDDSTHFEDQIAQLQSEVSEKDRMLEEAQTALQNAQSALEEAQEEQNRVGEEFERLKSIQQQAEAAQEGMKTELLAVQREMESLKEKYREGLSAEASLALRQQVTETAAQVTALQNELVEAREHTKKSVLALQLSEAIEESERLEEENARLRQQLGLVVDGRQLMDGGNDLQGAGVTAAPEPQVSRSPEDELKRIQRSALKWTHGPKRVIGQILLDAGVITEDQLETALELQKSNPQQHLGALLGELGFASDEAIAQARASQCGVDYIRFQDDTVDPEAATLISERLATQHMCIPITSSGQSMVLAVSNPMDLLAIEDVERFTNKKVEVVVGTIPDIEQAIARYFWEPE